MRCPAWDASVAEVLHPRTSVDDALVGVINDLREKVKAPMLKHGGSSPHLLNSDRPKYLTPW